MESLDNVPFKLKWEDSLGYVLQQAYKNIIREKPYAEIKLAVSTSSVELMEAEVSHTREAK
jgi:hypothetical protein